MSHTSVIADISRYTPSRCRLPLAEYHNELIREQMPTDRKMKRKQRTPSLIQSQMTFRTHGGRWRASSLLWHLSVHARRSKGRWWIRVRRRGFQVASCCGGSYELKINGCNQCQLSSRASLRTAFFTTSSAVEGLSFQVSVHRWQYYASPGQRFSLISCVARGGHHTEGRRDFTTSLCL